MTRKSILTAMPTKERVGPLPGRANGADVADPVTWATVDLDNDEEWDAFTDHQVEVAAERIQRAVKALQDDGIIDSQGRLLVDPGRLLPIDEPPTEQLA